MRVGVTGARAGINEIQHNNLTEWLKNTDVIQFRQGDCVGADVEVSAIIRETFPACVIITHPPIKDVLRGYFKADIILEEKSYFARNRDIVNGSEVLIGFPSHRSRHAGGTWYTINYAIKMGVRVYIFHKDGEVEPIKGKLDKHAWIL